MIKQIIISFLCGVAITVGFGFRKSFGIYGILVLVIIILKNLGIL